jgi:hypothetical protein
MEPTSYYLASTSGSMGGIFFSAYFGDMEFAACYLASSTR